MTTSQADRLDNASAWCRTFRHEFDGHVYQEKSLTTGKTVWVARLECARCGTQRVDTMTPKTCELISRQYIYPEEYQTGLTRTDARRRVFAAMRLNGRSKS